MDITKYSIDVDGVSAYPTRVSARGRIKNPQSSMDLELRCILQYSKSLGKLTTSVPRYSVVGDLSFFYGLPQAGAVLGAADASQSRVGLSCPQQGCESYDQGCGAGVSKDLQTGADPRVVQGVPEPPR
ncbi:hypothetical protein KY290_015778 [Solanum tuberosum]|uniref:Uncharacterized protein n=1 Tax=Solanum tuberosum TaxID=4113 RepID=A0ABQ7VW53_SOLTU|nr:hypothetical protein KY285_012843 [Solanum tuberosum]KAH0771797.1 hypothetical protein KY290_015778 [Solanum tuberosum]